MARLSMAGGAASVATITQAIAVSEISSTLELRSSADLERATALLEELPGAVLILDSAGVVRFMNRIAEHRIAHAREDVVGHDLFREIFPQLERTGFGERYRAAILQHPAALGWEATVSGPNGDRTVGFGIRSFVDEGERWGILLLEDRSALALEIDRRKRAERLAAIGELAAGAAHEINNPLASIKGFAQLLARDTLDRGQQQALDIISQECTRVSKIVDSLRDFAAQQHSVERERVDISEIAASVLNLKRYSLETSGVAIDADLDSSPSPVDGEKGALQRLVLILFNQAERSLNRRDSDRALQVRTRESNEGVALYVIDNGPGYPRHKLPFLLNGEADPETGLGLSTANSIAHDHGGTLWVESGEGKGTSFTLRLPRAAARAGVESELPSVEEHETDSSQTRRVLVADDESTLRLALAIFLRRSGYEVEQAEDADSAYEMATSGSYDAALIDVRMPGDGIVLLERLNAIPEWKGRAILMTGDHTQSRVRSVIRAGTPHLNKPFDMTEAVRLIEAVSTAAGPRKERKLSQWTSS